MSKRKRPRQNPKKRKSLRTNEVPVQATSVSESPRSLISGKVVLAALVLSVAVGVAVALSGRNQDPGSQNNAQRVSAPATGIFNPRKNLVDFTPENLETELKSRLEGRGVVFDFPEHYNPELPNLYLLANMHLTPAVRDPERIKKIMEVQNDNLEIYHVLAQLGVRRQFLEGIVSGIELHHDVPVPMLAEDVVRAMPGYRRSGKINRSYIAFEGVYGDDLESLGVEPSHDEREKIVRDRNEASRRFYSILSEVHQELAKRFPLDFQRDLRDQIWQEVSKLDEDSRRALIEEVLLSRSDYQEFLEAMSRHRHFRIQGRDQHAVKEILKNFEQDDKDSVYTVGSEHIGSLKRLFKGRDLNVIVLKAQALAGTDARVENCRSGFDLEDYKNAHIEYDLHIMGLGPAPKCSLYEKSK